MPPAKQSRQTKRPRPNRRGNSAHGGRYLLSLIFSVEKSGICEVPISDKECVPLLPGMEFCVIQESKRRSISTLRKAATKLEKHKENS